jgi:hypothetical protein
MAQQPQWARDSWSHADTPHSVGPPGRVISPTQIPLPYNTQHSQQTDIHSIARIRTHNPSKRAAVDPRLWPRSLWDRLQVLISLTKSKKVVKKGTVTHMAEQVIAGNKNSDLGVDEKLMYTGANLIRREHTCSYWSVMFSIVIYQRQL